MINGLQKGKSKLEEDILVLACIISTLSQLPILLGSGIVKLSVFACWILLLLYILYAYRGKFKLNITEVIFCIYSFDFFLITAQLLTGKNYLSSNLVYPINLSVFIFIVSYLVGQVVGADIIDKISKYYIASCLIVAIYVFFETFKGADWSNSLGYLYTSKNSLAQILLVALIFILFFQVKMKVIFRWGSTIFIIAMLVMLKSRATLIGLAITFIYWGTIAKKKRKERIILLVLITFIIIVLTNDNLYDLLINKIILNNRVATDLNTISSGRMDHVNIFIYNIKEFWGIGNGGMYLESFPLASLISYGIVGFMPIIILAFMPLVKCFKKPKSKSLLNLRHVVILLSLTMLVNGLFEELSPFGPGVKCYMLWLLFGLYTGLKYSKKVE